MISMRPAFGIGTGRYCSVRVRTMIFKRSRGAVAVRDMAPAAAPATKVTVASPAMCPIPLPADKGIPPRRFQRGRSAVCALAASQISVGSLKVCDDDNTPIDAIAHARRRLGEILIAMEASQVEVATQRCKQRRVCVCFSTHTHTHTTCYIAPSHRYGRCMLT